MSQNFSFHFSRTHLNLLLIHASWLGYLFYVYGKHVLAYQGERKFSAILVNCDVTIFQSNNFTFNEIMEIKPIDKIIKNRYKINNSKHNRNNQFSIPNNFYSKEFIMISPIPFYVYSASNTILITNRGPFGIFWLFLCITYSLEAIVLITKYRT